MSMNANKDIVAQCERTLSELKAELDALTLDVDISGCTGAYSEELQTLINGFSTIYKKALNELIEKSQAFATNSYYTLMYADRYSSV